MVGIIMYGKIQELKALGYKKQRAARELDIDTKTVRKYWNMSEDEYLEILAFSKERIKNMDPYRDYVLTKLQTHREITSAIIFDNLLEDYEDFEPSYRSVRRYVAMLRESEGIPSPAKIRQYMEVLELPMGFQAQVDLGFKTMKDMYGKSIKVYIFAMVLSCSRYKYICYQLDPFTAKTFCEAHDRAFKYLGGRPVEIVYDQDRVMVVSENGGDIIFTDTFDNYRNYVGFSVRLCRGSDPESKGKVEAVVKYAKGNFLSCRIFHGIARLNSDGLAWLDRTGNGMVHETTKIIPKVAFVEEQKYLKLAPELGETVVIPKIAKIRKNNVVFYKQNRYQLPSGTYQPGRRARIETDDADGKICFYDSSDNEFLYEHKLAEEGVVGKCIRNCHPHRNRKTPHKDLVDKVRDGFGRHEITEEFVNLVIAEKPRYTRDQMSIIKRHQEKYTKDELLNAVSYCMARELFSASDLGDALGYFATDKDIPLMQLSELPLKYSIVTAEKRPLDTYASLSGVEGCVRQ